GKSTEHTWRRANSHLVDSILASPAVTVVTDGTRRADGRARRRKVRAHATLTVAQAPRWAILVAAALRSTDSKLPFDGELFLASSNDRYASHVGAVQTLGFARFCRLGKACTKA